MKDFPVLPPGLQVPPLIKQLRGEGKAAGGEREEDISRESRAFANTTGSIISPPPCHTTPRSLLKIEIYQSGWVDCRRECKPEAKEGGKKGKKKKDEREEGEKNRQS